MEMSDGRALRPGIDVEIGTAVLTGGAPSLVGVDRKSRQAVRSQVYLTGKRDVFWL